MSVSIRPLSKEYISSTFHVRLHSDLALGDSQAGRRGIPSRAFHISLHVSYGGYLHHFQTALLFSVVSFFFYVQAVASESTYLHGCVRWPVVLSDGEHESGGRCIL